MTVPSPALASFRRLHVAFAAVLSVGTLLSSCGGLPEAKPRAVSMTPTAAKGTRLAARVQPLVAAHPGQSGIHLLANGLDAFAARLALASAAQRSLDVQYYIWNKDDTAKLLTMRLLQAAEGGVKVRLLLDDLGAVPTDRELLALDGHPNIEIRLFNPASVRSNLLLGLLSAPARMNRRMHNKAFIADGQVAIVGGRNIGDEYFAAAQEMNFADLDAALIGPAAGEVSTSFDLYWNHRAAIGVSDLAKPKDAAHDLAAMRATLARHEAEVMRSRYAESVRTCALAAHLKHGGRVPYHWGVVRLVYDHPDKVLTSAAESETHMAPKLKPEVDATTQELYLVSPYFVPGRRGVEMLVEARRKGPRVVVVTNSLASTDGVPVHSGYQRYRKPLLRGGIELYEMKPTAEKMNSKVSLLRSGSSGASLHAKTFAFDRRTIFVGSFNLDPRSSRLNTEIGALMECPELAAQLPEKTDRALAANAWRVQLEGRRLVWTTREEGAEVRETQEPATTFWRRLQCRIFSWLPIEGLL